jgi:hypothetical protein
VKIFPACQCWCTKIRSFSLLRSTFNKVASNVAVYTGRGWWIVKTDSRYCWLLLPVAAILGFSIRNRWLDSDLQISVLVLVTQCWSHWIFIIIVLSLSHTSWTGELFVYFELSIYLSLANSPVTSTSHFLLQQVFAAYGTLRQTVV